MRSALLFQIAILTLSSSLVRADIKLANVFGDHVVLQRDRPIVIWGWAESGENINVSLGDQQADTVADQNGNWSVTLAAQPSSREPKSLVVKGKTTIRVNDILIGEVWHASGQSNMAMTLGEVARQIEPIKEQVSAANWPGFRMMRIDEPGAAQPADDLPARTRWIVCTPETAPSFSAVAFFFASRLQHDLDVPIGIIDTSRGGTPIEPYIPRSAFTSHPTLVRELELGDQEDLAGLTKMPGGVWARDGNWLPGRLFHSRISPISRFAVRGTIWYQGESNCGVGEDPRDYQHKMRALIAGWRESFGQPGMPFYFVQLPGSGAGPRWPYLREQQRLSMDVAQSGMAVTIDLEANDIHPPNKYDVGERLARWALANDYKKPTIASGPLFAKAVFQDAEVTVSFAYADSGLMVGAKRGIEPIVETPDTLLRHFELADTHGRWWPAKAKISGSIVNVSSNDVPKPVAIRYAYRVSPGGANLFNRDGLPAAPFCSHPEKLKFDESLPAD